MPQITSSFSPFALSADASFQHAAFPRWDEPLCVASLRLLPPNVTADMERDAAIQRGRVRDLVMAAAKRAETFVVRPPFFSFDPLPFAHLSSHPPLPPELLPCHAHACHNAHALSFATLVPHPCPRCFRPQDAELRLRSVVSLRAFTGGGFQELTTTYAQTVVGQGMQELTEALREHTSWRAHRARIALCIALASHPAPGGRAGGHAPLFFIMVMGRGTPVGASVLDSRTIGARRDSISPGVLLSSLILLRRLARNSQQQSTYYTQLVAERGAAAGGFDSRLSGEERRRRDPRRRAMQTHESIATLAASPWSLIRPGERLYSSDG